MTIAFIGQKGIPATSGGVERYVESLAVRLARAGHQTVVYTRPNYTASAALDYRGVRLVSLPIIATKNLEAISHCWLATWQACRQNVEVIHYQTIGAALTIWLPRLWRPKIKIISTLQSRDYEHGKWRWPARLALRLGERLMCWLSDEVIVVTAEMVNYVQTKYKRSAHYIPNGAETVTASGSDCLANYGLTPGGYILSVSRLVPHKGLLTLIKAYRQLNTDCRLVIVGGGAYTDYYIQELKAAARGNGNIIFTGPLFGPALAQLYAHAAVFVQPSESEGLSLSLLEAMSASRPVLVSDIAENLAAVQETGFTFRCRDEDDLAGRLKFILSHPELATAKGQAARQRVEQEFNWDKIVARISQLYHTDHKAKLLFRKSTSVA